jgi:cobalt-zinc-cadmium efflux system protein
VSRTRRLSVVLLLNLGLVAGLIVVGVTAHSVAVFAEGGDYLLDAAGAGVALLAASRVAALVNAGWLLALQLLVAGAAAYRLAAGPPRVDGLAVLVVSGVAAVVMAAAALVLRGDGDDGDSDGDGDDNDLSVKAVLLDTVADAAAAAGVAVTGAVILAARGWYWLDPAVALTIAVIVAYHAARLIRRVLRLSHGAG